MNKASACFRNVGAAFFTVRSSRSATLRAGIGDLGFKDQLMPFLSHVDNVSHFCSFVVVDLSLAIECATKPVVEIGHTC